MTEPDVTPAAAADNTGETTADITADSPQPTESRPARPRPEFYETLGLRVVSARDGTAVVELPDSVGFRNSRGEMHGGAVLALADIAVSQAVRSRLGPADGVATISLTMNFSRPASAPTRAVGRVVSLGGRVGSAQVDIESGGQVVAHGVASIRVFRAR